MGPRPELKPGLSKRRSSLDEGLTGWIPETPELVVVKSFSGLSCDGEITFSRIIFNDCHRVDRFIISIVRLLDE